MTDGYPFHTGETGDGVEIVGVLFVAGNGQFYEFQDPESHDDWARWECPRTGDVMTYSNVLDESIKKAMGGHVKAKIPAEDWVEFRAEYVGAEEERTEEWRETWEAIHKEARTRMVTVE